MPFVTLATALSHYNEVGEEGGFLKQQEAHPWPLPESVGRLPPGGQQERGGGRELGPDVPAEEQSGARWLCTHWATSQHSSGAQGWCEGTGLLPDGPNPRARAPCPPPHRAATLRRSMAPQMGKPTARKESKNLTSRQRAVAWPWLWAPRAWTSGSPKGPSEAKNPGEPAGGPLGPTTRVGVNTNITNPRALTMQRREREARGRDTKRPSFWPARGRRGQMEHVSTDFLSPSPFLVSLPFSILQASSGAAQALSAAKHLRAHGSQGGSWGLEDLVSHLLLSLPLHSLGKTPASRSPQSDATRAVLVLL